MSDTNKPNDTDDLQNDSDEHKARRTQIVKKPKLRSRTQPPPSVDGSPVKHTSILSSDNPLLKRALSQNASADHTGTTNVSDSREVLLLIRGMVERMDMEEHTAYTLGRFDMGVKGAYEVDLTPYGAQDRGVSRQHAVLHVESDRLYLTDLDSTNGTYVAGERLEANTPTIVHKGDEILLGRLSVQIMFR